jgi:Cdc25 family phosphatase
MMVEYMDAETLRGLLKGKNVQVVDVRDEDFKDYIPGAMNVPSELWDDASTILMLIEKTAGKEHVVFHCMKSQQRGPFCARLFHEALGEAASTTATPKVHVLRFGFSGWRNTYCDDEGLIVWGTDGVERL